MNADHPVSRQEKESFGVVVIDGFLIYGPAKTSEMLYDVK
jgi:hypothetical protein